MNRTFGLIGYPLSHSFSQRYFTEKFRREGIQNAEFVNFSMEDISSLPELIKANPQLLGLSVTIPHKRSVLPLLNEIDDTASDIGAVNCIKIIRSGDQITTKGFNTDAAGFYGSLQPLLQPHHLKALILGTGGAARAVSFVLDMSNIIFSYVSRTANKNPGRGKILSYADLNAQIIQEHTVIINTTPLGMHPAVDSFPEIPYEALTEKHLLYDLTYNPEETMFLKKGKTRGATIKNGYEMLCLQAEAAWKIWNK